MREDKGDVETGSNGRLNFLRWMNSDFRGSRIRSG